VVSAPAAPRGHPELGRVPTVLRSLRPLLLHLAEAALFCAVAGAAAARSVRRRLGLGSDIWSWVALIAAAVSLVGAYALTPYDLAWQLGTSVDRTTVGIRIMLVAEVAVWSLLAVTRLTPPAIPEAAPAPPSVAPTEVLVE